MNDENTTDKALAAMIGYSEFCIECGNTIFFQLYEGTGECMECGNKQERYTNVTGNNNVK